MVILCWLVAWWLIGFVFLAMALLISNEDVTVGDALKVLLVSALGPVIIFIWLVFFGCENDIFDRVLIKRRKRNLKPDKRYW